MKNFTFICIFYAAFVSMAYAEPIRKLDEQGRLVLQINDDGTSSNYSYDKDGKITVNASSRDQEIHFDKNGKTTANQNNY